MKVDHHRIAVAVAIVVGDCRLRSASTTSDVCATVCGGGVQRMTNQFLTLCDAWISRNHP